MRDLPRYIVTVFDGLRPDMVVPEVAPNLCRFIAEGSSFPLSRAVFPSVTRVNVAALSCGTVPGGTGIVANRFHDPHVYADRLLNTARHEDVAAAELAYRGRWVTAPALGDVLAGHGMTVAVVSSGSAGATHLLNPRAGALGHVTLGLADWRTSTPADYAARILARFGPIPASARPNTPRVERQMDIVLHAVLPEVRPDVLFVWISEPDSTYHDCGIGSPESLAAIRGADEQFGRLVERWRASPDQDRCDLFVCSDHGHVTAQRRVDVKAAMREAGLALGTVLDPGTAFAGSAGYYGALRARDGDPALIRAACEWLAGQPWCGPVFTTGGDGLLGGVPGTFDRSLLRIDHARAPDLYYAMRGDDAANRWGVPGCCWFDSGEVPDGGGIHGALHPREMHNVLAVLGAGFRRGYLSPWPAGHVDIVPTLLARLGFGALPGATGRILAEALDGGAVSLPRADPAEVRVRSGGVEHGLRYWRMGGSMYLDHGWTADGRGEDP